jgi:hypothetical protein
MSNDFHRFLTETLEESIDLAGQEFHERISAWDIDIFEKETNEVVGGLLARQVSLATNVASSPSMWNAHILPIILRCMADVYITFCWIAQDMKPRSRQFMEYGLGQEKLAIEKYREVLSEEGAPDPDAQQLLAAREQMLDAERLRFLLPVNLGSWSEMNMRDMAIEVGEKKFYDLVFTQFSAPVHSTWQHIWRMNLLPCSNPLHMGHRVPDDPILPPDLHLFMNSAKYLCKTFARFDAVVLQVEREAFKCYDRLDGRFSQYAGVEQA